MYDFRFTEHNKASQEKAPITVFCISVCSPAPNWSGRAVKCVLFLLRAQALSCILKPTVEVERAAGLVRLLQVLLFVSLVWRREASSTSATVRWVVSPLPFGGKRLLDIISLNTLRSEISPARTRFQGLRKELKHLRSSYTTVNKSLDLWNAQEAGPHGRWETAGFQTLVKCQEGGSQAFTTQLVTCFQQEVPATAPSLLSGHVRGTAGCQAPATQSLPPLAGMCVCVCTGTCCSGEATPKVG